MICRHCGKDRFVPFADLGTSPPSNSYLTFADASGSEKWYPLRVAVCANCWLVQTEDFAERDEFFSDDYAYFSSYSISWLEHAERYVSAMTDRFGLGDKSLIVEVASNDGYLLQYAIARGIRALGIEPTESTAQAARAKGIEVVQEFFGVELARSLVAQGRIADVTTANNVLAHVPDINDFVAGFAILLAPQGVATFEFPHLLRMVEENQFDTIYHEHYSYLSLNFVNAIFAANGLRLFDVEELPTHGGSLRVFATPTASGTHAETPAVKGLLAREANAGMRTEAFYSRLQVEAERIADELAQFLITARAEGKRACAYGAAAKGNTLINFAGIKPRLLPWIVDRSPSKQHKLAPGSRIPIVEEARIRAEKPDYVLILPWNLRDEIMEQLSYVRTWGGQFVTAIPRLTVL